MGKSLLVRHEQIRRVAFTAPVSASTSVGSELVDLVCIGSGCAGLAAAISAAEAGLSVVVAEPPRRPSHAGQMIEVGSWAAAIKRHWGAEEFDESTNNYLHQLTHELNPPCQSHAPEELPVGIVESFKDATVHPRSPVPPFHGSEMGDWARDCLTSSYGLVFSHLDALKMSQVRMQNGATVKVSVIGDVHSARWSGMTTLRQCLLDLAYERGVKLYGSNVVQRLLFDDGRPVGAVLMSADGIRHVWARRGVAMGTSDPMIDDQLDSCPTSILRNGRLSLVSRDASPFARLELLTSAQSQSVLRDAMPTVCAGGSRTLPPL